jgi:twitching motility two-component system response regulator PilG
MQNISIEVTAHGTLHAIFSVLPLGLSEAELATLRRLFGVALVRPLHYHLLATDESAHAHFAIVDAQDGAALERWRQIGDGRRLPTLFIGDPPAKSEGLGVQRPLLLPRVLGALDRLARAESQLMLARHMPEARPDKARVQVLVVDDSAAVRSLLREELAKRNLVPDEAESGEAALVKLLHTPYDVVVLDVVMPGIDGYAVCKQIKLRRGNKPRVIMLTSRDGAFDKVRGKLSGCDAYLSKPLDRTRLHTLLSGYISEIERSQQAA